MKKEKLIFYFSGVMFFISSGVIFFIPFNCSSTANKSKGIECLLGCIFWLFLTIGLIFQFILNRLRKKNIRRLRPRCLLLKFFNNNIAIFFDLIFIVSIISNIIFLIFKINIEWLQVLMVFALLFGLEMHFMFNSENFKYINKNLGGHKK